jgi:hypothetical protein
MKKLFFPVAMALMMCACGGNTKTGAQTAAEPDTPSAADFAAMQALYDDAEDDHGWMPLCKWQYVDLDGDGLNEVWMRDKAEEYGAMFSLADGKVSLIGIETDRFGAYTLEQQDGKGYFCKGGPAGGPSYYTEIVTLKDSRVVERFNQLQVYDDIDGAGLNGKDISQDEARAYTKALPESKELTPGEWNLLDLTDYDRVPAHDNSAKDDKLIMGFITEMYNNSMYTEVEFLEEHCTPRMLQQLLDDYEYDGEGYAFWDFRSESNDSTGGEIIDIEKKDGRYYYEASDGGYIFRNILSAFVQDGKVMFDGIAVDATYDVFDPFANDSDE